MRLWLCLLCCGGVLICGVLSKRTENETNIIQRVIEKWAPLVWLATGENYFPLAVDEFLQHVYPSNDDGKIVSSALPTGKSSEVFYLITKRNLESLKNGTSFLNGRNPRKEPVPVYVIFSECVSSKSTICSTDTNKLNRIFPICEQSVQNPTVHDEQPPTSGSFRKPIRYHLTYWMFYPYNEGKEVCFIGRFPAPFIFNTCLGRVKTYGNHVGDFERVSLSFTEDHIPDEIFLSVHDIGVYYKYDAFSGIFKYNRELKRKGALQKVEYPPIIRTYAGRPVLFAAKGSHGLWSAPGNFYYLRLPKLYDHSGHGIAWKTWKHLRVYRSDSVDVPAWMRYLGKWGNPKSNCFPFSRLGVCELTDGPIGISRRRQDFYCDRSM